MTQSSYSAWLFGVALTLLGFGAGSEKATAQTIYPFEATYNAVINTRPLAPNIVVTNEAGVSTDAPYGLTEVAITNYAKFDPDTSVFTFGPEPEAFGLEGLPSGTFTLKGNGTDSVFGTISGSVLADFQNLVGTGTSTVTITGGSGIFGGATGTLNVLENDTFSPDPTAPIQARFSINGSFLTPQAVPEPKTDAALVGVGLIGIGFLLLRHRSRSLSNTNPLFVVVKSR